MRVKCLVAILLSASLWAASPQPVRAKHGMVVSVEENASRAGVEALKRGGNAVDAAVATGLALAVTHPQAGNLGGGGFMLIRWKDGRSTFIDFRERAPGAAHRSIYLDEKGEVIKDASMVGYRASGVPGTVAGLEFARKKYGRKRWSELVKAAERLAKKGFPVSDHLSRSLSSASNTKLLGGFPESKRIFLRDGRPYERGEVFKQKELGATLSRLRKRGAKEFYEGRIAQQLAAFMQANGGLITAEDLAKYQVKEREPLKGTFRGYEITTAPPPSSGGVAMLEMLNILEETPLTEFGGFSARAIHWTTEAMRRAFADRAQFLGDPDFSRIPVKGLIDKKYAAHLRATIDPERASLSSVIRAGDPMAYETSGETTHYSVVDSDGTAVSVTYTLNNSYGSGVTVAGLGFLMNNEMDDFTVKPGVPNAYGLLQSEANTIAPGKTPLSAMTPTVVTKDGKLVLVLGSPGGPTIINTVMNTILNFLEFKLNVQQAVDAPRFHHQWMPDKLILEPGFSPDTLELLRSRGHQIEFRNAIGDCHAIAVDSRTGEWLGAADPRLGGKAVGY